MLTTQEIIPYLKNSNGKYGFDYHMFRKPKNNQKTDSGKEFNIVLEEQYGGEKMGEEYYIVLRTECENTIQYWMIPGWYQSFEGSEIFLDETYEVLKNYVQTILWDPKK